MPEERITQGKSYFYKKISYLDLGQLLHQGSTSYGLQWLMIVKAFDSLQLTCLVMALCKSQSTIFDSTSPDTMPHVRRQGVLVI